MTTKEQMLTTYMGQDIEEMTRDELIDALRITCRILNEHLTPGRSRAVALGLVEMMKRGESLSG